MPTASLICDSLAPVLGTQGSPEAGSRPVWLRILTCMLRTCPSPLLPLTVAVTTTNCPSATKLRMQRSLLADSWPGWAWMSNLSAATSGRRKAKRSFIARASMLIPALSAALSAMGGELCLQRSLQEPSHAIRCRRVQDVAWSFRHGFGETAIRTRLAGLANFAHVEAHERSFGAGRPP